MTPAHPERAKRRRRKRRLAQAALLALLVYTLAAELIDLFYPALFIGLRGYLRPLISLETLVQMHLRIPLLLLFAVPVVGWGLLCAGKETPGRNLVIYPLSAAILLDLLFTFLHMLRGASHWMPSEVGFAALEGLPLLILSTLALICLHVWQPK